MKKTVSLKSNRDFTRVYKKGKFSAGRYVVLYVLQNSLNINRIGITASKKTGKSVKRNRIKRLIRENYRLSEDRVKVGYDLVFVVRNTEVMPDFYKIKKEVNYLLRKFSIIEEKDEKDSLENNKRSDNIIDNDEKNKIEEFWKMVRGLLIYLIKSYQKYISPLKPPRCRFYPTCSQYALEAIEKYGAIRGSLMAIKRILKCHPFNSGGYDPVK